ncbi:alpha/beta fold hydrolase, partial [Nocardia wallacei]|uniref:alpha/beta fold hydrolase n=1 Tax=Nocardia wallacei TaxID=480035 RepID=UPI002457E1F5
GAAADCARRAFAPAWPALHLPSRGGAPAPGGVGPRGRAALDPAARSGPVLAAGISLGAAIAVEWARARADSAFGVIAALPAWTGDDAGDCPAALSAATTAAQLRADGLEAVVGRMRDSSPDWLAAALTQSWTAQWPHLPEALEEAAAYPWPTPETLAGLSVPATIVTAVDDPVHPLTVAERWAALIPRSELHRITLAELGADPGILGCRGLARLAGRHAMHR